MNTGCDQLRKVLGEFALVHDCYALEDKTYRIATPFQYPDGSLIDVFIKPDSPEDGSPLIKGWSLSDFGQTTTYLMDVNVKPRKKTRQWQLIKDICYPLDIDFKGGELVTWIDPEDPKAAAAQVVRLMQACLRVADLSFFQKFSPEISFRVEVERFLGSSLTTPVKLTGRWGRTVEIDYEYHGPHKSSLLKTISTGGTSSNVHPLLTEAFSRWFDLESVQPESPRVTLIDDKEKIGRTDDVKRLEEVSAV